MRIWRGGGVDECVVLTGHAQAVWAVLPLPAEHGVASASGDRTIRLWRGGRCTATLTGHTDVVRGLCLVAGLGFASASNDGSLRLWALDGAALLALPASESFVYAVAALPGGELACCGEDRYARRPLRSGRARVEARDAREVEGPGTRREGGEGRAGCAA